MATVKVSREGVVLADGKNVGYVKKEMRQGLHATLLGVSYGLGEGTPYWIPFTADGTRLCEEGYPTRKRAVDRLVKHAQPLRAEDFRVEYGIGSNSKCVTGWVRWQGFSAGVSRYAGEDYWVVDFLATPDSLMPVFSHGAGSRYTSLRTLKPEMADVATAAATAAGVWPMKSED